MNRLGGILLCLLPTIVCAERGDLPIRSAGPYVGGGLGLGDAKLKTALGTLDGTELGYKLMAGYRWWTNFMPWNTDIGVELAYVDLGERTGTLGGSAWKMSSSGFTTDVVGYWPITRQWELLGKGGLFFSDTELESVEIDVPGGEDSGTDLTVGVGAAYHRAGGFGARVELEYLGAKDGAMLLSASAIYKFK